MRLLFFLRIESVLFPLIQDFKIIFQQDCQYLPMQPRRPICMVFELARSTPWQHPTTPNPGNFRRCRSFLYSCLQAHKLQDHWSHCLLSRRTVTERQNGVVTPERETSSSRWLGPWIGREADHSCVEKKIWKRHWRQGWEDRVNIWELDRAKPGPVQLHRMSQNQVV